MKQPLWWPGLQIPKPSDALWSGYSARFLSRIPSTFLRVLQAGEDAEILLIARDIALWSNLARQNWCVSTSTQESHAIRGFIDRLPSLFGLPRDTQLSAYVTDWPYRILELGITCYVTVDDIEWRVQRWENWPLQRPSNHEMLELQRRLRDALRPFFTPAEIEEILASPARL